MDEIDALFAEDGPLARAFDGFRVRAPQVEMAREVLQAIRERGTRVLEAGTGVGKTAAYLVPALLEGGKVIVSTGTKTLQDQLFHRDLPAIRAALAVPVTVALLKGRANYVCLYHLARTEAEGLLASRQETRDLRDVGRFAQLSASGDKSECATVPEHATIWARVTSTRDNCLGSECPQHGECFVMKARRQAQDADVVVVNHHLFFADLMLREEGVSSLLPSAQTVIFDEAHQLPHTATLFFGDTVSSAQLLELCRDALAEGMAQARDATNWPQALAPLERATRDLRLCFAAGSQRLAVGQIAADSGFGAALDRLQAALAGVNELLAAQAERSPGLAQLYRRGAALSQLLDAWNAPERADEPELCWIDVLQAGVQLHRTPISVAELFRRQRLGLQAGEPVAADERAAAGTADPAASASGASSASAAAAAATAAPAWFPQPEAEPAEPEVPPQPQAWVFTSATLAVKQDFSHFTRDLGLDDARCRSWASPFDYPNQALLYVPERLPEPNTSGHTDALVDAALPLLRTNCGRAFVLCTTHRAVERAAQRLREAFEGAGDPYLILRQGEAARGLLLQRFREHGNAVLVGSQSFWEGVDVRGEALSLVVIDKLPFTPPDDPVLAKRLELLAQAGGNPFMEHQVPQAIITLKQGAGRLIRGETDRGVLMIGDTRLVTKPYGRRIWQSLPPMRRTREETVALDFIRQGERPGAPAVPGCEPSPADGSPSSRAHPADAA
jgi:ATP-dependent DNA helicase DinG